MLQRKSEYLFEEVLKKSSESTEREFDGKWEFSKEAWKARGAGVGMKDPPEVKRTFPLVQEPPRRGPRVVPESSGRMCGQQGEWPPPAQAHE